LFAGITLISITVTDEELPSFMTNQAMALHVLLVDVGVAVVCISSLILGTITAETITAEARERSARSEAKQTRAALTRLEQYTAEEQAVVKEIMSGGASDEDAELKSWEIPYSHLEVVRRVGYGSHGIVWQAIYRDSDCAVKELLPSKVDESHVMAFRSEVLTMCRLRHPNLVLFMGACWQPPHICIVMEYMPRGSLLDALMALKLTWEDPLLRIACDVASAMCYLHGQTPAMLHRDLKSPNILLSATYAAKLGDFGESRFLSTDSTMTAVGTPYWVAPEVFRANRYDRSADVYSFAIVLAECVVGPAGIESLFPLGNPMVAARRVAQGFRPALPAEFRKAWPVLHALVEKCWDANTRERPTFPVILRTLQHIMAGGARPSALEVVAAPTAKHSLLPNPLDSVPSVVASTDFGDEEKTKRRGVDHTLLKSLGVSTMSSDDVDVSSDGPVFSDFKTTSSFPDDSVLVVGLDRSESTGIPPVVVHPEAGDVSQHGGGSYAVSITPSVRPAIIEEREPCVGFESRSPEPLTPTFDVKIV
jgi:serine/threonine protein kinase